MDTMNIEIAEDGLIVVTVANKISAPNHINADAFEEEISKLAGGTVSQRRIGQTHSHEGTHEHEGH